IQWIVSRAAQNPNRRVTIVDWGAGNAQALIDLAKGLQRLGVRDKVRLIGFADMYFGEWEEAAANGIEFKIDLLPRLAGHFAEEGIDLIYSYWGLRQLEGKAAAHLLELQSRMAPGGIILSNGNLPEGPLKDELGRDFEIAEKDQSFLLKRLPKSEMRNQDDPEPQRDRPDVRTLFERATDRSRVQRKQLSDSGFEIEEVVRKVLANDAIRIAVVPVGSTLKGYAGIGSDLDYLIYFLAGLSPDFKIGEKEAAKIFEEANKITAKNGPAGPDEKVDKVDEFFNYSGIAHHSLSAGEIAGLFFPVAYGDSALIEEARRQALRQVEAQSAPLDFWADVQAAYTEATLFDPSSAKSNLFEWLGKHGLKAPMPWNPENLYGEDVKIQERQVRQYEEEARAIRARMAPETALPGFPEMLNAYGPPRSEMRSGNPISWLSRAILTVGQHDHRMETLNLEDLSAELPKLKQMLRKEKNLVAGLEDRLTDQNSALDILLERIKDQIFTAPFGTQVNLVMISLPMVALNQISKDYLPGFADAFKKYFHRRLVQEYKMKAAFFGTRIVIANYDPLLAQDQLFSIIQKAAGDVESENESKIKRLSPKDLKSYKKMFNNALARLSISHAPLYLENPPRENPMEDPSNFPRYTAQEDPLKPREVSPQKFETMPEEKRIEHVVDADEKLGQLREKWSLAASFWRAKISGAPSAEERAAARPKANFFIERLLQDVIARLYERGEVLEKAPADLRAEINKLTDARGADKKGVLPIFDQNVVRQLIAQIREKDNKENSGDPVLPKFYVALQEGRRSAPPIFEYRKRGVVRMAGMPRRGHLLGNLDRISENLRQALKDLEKRPSEASLKRFKKIYRDYQFARYEALVLGYRDPRLEEYYKMDKIGEVARADELGLLDQLKERLAALSKRARKKEIRDRFQRLAGLIEPGLLPYKRPVGDETWFAVKTGEKKHKIAFSELTQGRGFFVANPPDEQDSTYHEILLAQWELAKRHYAGWKTAKNQEPWWGFLKQFDDEILRLAPNLYPGIAKVPVKGVKERMTGFVKVGDTTSRFPDYARDERGQLWELNARKEWEKTNKIKPEDLKPFETLLTSARNYDDEEAGAARIEAVSYKLDGL
ncbi:MAG TPA: hypothetical protein VJC08_04055, partial [bacterium]|nr:hypothetical protein [bacterium]